MEPGWAPAEEPSALLHPLKAGVQVFLIKLAPFGRLRTQHSNATKSQSLIVIVLSMPGAGNMDPKVACTAMLDGIEAAVRSMGQTTLTLVRIVFFQRDVHKDFRYNENCSNVNCSSRQESTLEENRPKDVCFR